MIDHSVLPLPLLLSVSLDFPSIQNQKNPIKQNRINISGIETMLITTENKRQTLTITTTMHHCNSMDFVMI